MTQQFVFNVFRLEPLPPPLPSPVSRHQRGIDLYSPSPSATLVATGSPASVAARLQINGAGHQPKCLTQSGFTGAPLALKMTFPTGAQAASECRKTRLNTSRGAEEDEASSVGYTRHAGHSFPIKRSNPAQQLEEIILTVTKS